MSDEKKAKKPWLSKTLWANIIIAASAFYPPAREALTKNPELVLSLLSGVNMILRLITKDKISLETK